jgi:outer membrane receptor protein involved in Fe transport
MHSKGKISLLIAMALASGTQAMADESAVSLDELVVTGTRSETPLLEQAGNTGKVSEEEIDLVRPDHITEIANRISGVNIQHGNGQEHLTSIRSPVLTGGAGAGSFLFLEDGIPLRAAGFANVNGLFEVNYEQAGGIEVVRGPGSAFYGSNAVHGLVNVLTRAPSLKLEREIDLSVGPHDLYTAKATISDSVGNHGYRVNVLGTSDGGYVSDSGYDQQKVSLRHDYYGDIDSFKTIFSYTNLNQETAGYIVGFKAYEDESVSRTNPNPEAYRDAKSYRLSTEWIRELSDSSRFSLTPYIRHTEMDFLMHFLPGQPVEENQHSSVGLLSSFTQELDGGHKVILGTDLEYTEGELSEVQFNPRVFFNGFPSDFVPGTHYDYEVDATVIAPYIHTEWQILDKTRVTAGLRYEYTRYDYTNKASSRTLPPSGRYLRPDSDVDTFSNFSPKLGLIQQLSDDTAAFINYSRGNRAPQTTDLYRAQIVPSQTGSADSEQIDSVEVGVRKVGEGLQYEVTAYHMKKRDYFFTDTNNQNVPNGKTQHTGLELSVFYPFNASFDIAANVTFAKHEYDFNKDSAGIEKGDYLVTAPRRMGNIRLGWNVTPQTRTELEWVHMSEYYINDGNTAKYEGHDVFNLRASHDVTENFTVYGRIKNLFNTEYAERADFGGGGGGDYRYFVGEKRYLHVGASYRF